jgi:hypothetical protein
MSTSVDDSGIRRKGGGALVILSRAGAVVLIVYRVLSGISISLIALSWGLLAIEEECEKIKQGEGGEYIFSICDEALESIFPWRG